MSDLLSDFALHVGTGTALGPLAGVWHRQEADWRERELRDFMASLGAVLKEARKTMTDAEQIAITEALLAAHPQLTEPAPADV
jgi:hypothetical protein